MSEKGNEALSADFYYCKALAYLSMEHEDDAQPSCGCQHCHSDEEEDDDFSMGFRRSLTHDHGQGSAGSSISSGSDVTRTSPTSPGKSERPRQRRHSTVERPKISGEEFGKPV
nr:hypothetical protein BaRGS_009001 [Batillaria attramentaria]